MNITAKQWQFILLNMLGLRSGETPDDISKAASYAMDCGVKVTIPFPPIPEKWEAMLSGTITHMQEFPGYEKRFLLIVSKSSGNNFEYDDCFPKCSAKPDKVWSSISLNNSVEELKQWVVANIPEQ